MLNTYLDDILVILTKRINLSLTEFRRPTIIWLQVRLDDWLVLSQHSILIIFSS